MCSYFLQNVITVIILHVFVFVTAVVVIAFAVVKSYFNLF